MGRNQQFYEWTIWGHTDSNFATNPNNLKTVLGKQVFLNESPVMAKSSTQKVVTLPVTEAKYYTATSCAQDVLFVWQIMQVLEQKVKFPQVLQCNNRGTKQHELTRIQ